MFGCDPRDIGVGIRAPEHRPAAFAELDALGRVRVGAEPHEMVADEAEAFESFSDVREVDPLGSGGRHGIGHGWHLFLGPP